MEKQMNRKRQLNEREQLKSLRKALLVTHVSGFVPQFEMNNVRILQSMGYEVHYASNFNTPSYGTDNHRLDAVDEQRQPHAATLLATRDDRSPPHPCLQPVPDR